MKEYIAGAVSAVAGDLAAKHEFTALYQAADRHGVAEWLYQHHGAPEDSLQQYVSLAGWRGATGDYEFESTAGLVNPSGYTKQAVKRAFVSEHEAETGEWDTFYDLLVPAFERAHAMYYQALDAARAGEATVETPYVVRRQIVS